MNHTEVDQTQKNREDCIEVRKNFSGYLDGAVSGVEMQAVDGHLKRCSDCAAEFQSWVTVQGLVATLARETPPQDLGVRLRVAISHENARRQGHWWDGLAVRWENGLRPLMVQASAGLASALVLLGGIGALIGMVAAPRAVMANDEPLGAMTAPHYLYSQAPQQPIQLPGQLTSQQAGQGTCQASTIVIEAKINAEGRVFDYTILSGPQNAETLAQIRDQLMLQVYEPARVFGEPIAGRVLTTFAAVSVRG